MLGICFCSSFSTSNFNPIVSLMNYFRKNYRITLPMLIIYLLSQITGTVCGILFSHYYNQSTRNGFIPKQNDTAYLLKLAFG
jgi:glycerol uptake facilitator-like aquaporin